MCRGNEGIFGQWVEEMKEFLAELSITWIAESESENREIFQFHEISLFTHFEMKVPNPSPLPSLRNQGHPLTEYVGGLKLNGLKLIFFARAIKTKTSALRLGKISVA